MMTKVDHLEGAPVEVRSVYPGMTEPGVVKNRYLVALVVSYDRTQGIKTAADAATAAEAMVVVHNGAVWWVMDRLTGEYGFYMSGGGE